MTSALFAYPPGTTLGRILPKNKIYQHGNPGKTIKTHFIDQVEHIIWQHKLSPETIRIPATHAVPEIQVFTIILKSEALSTDVLRCIDHAIPFPILFELSYRDKVKLTAAYKYPDKSHTVGRIIGDYLSGNWISTDAPRKPLPIALDLETLYENILRSMMAYPARPAESMVQHIERIAAIRMKQQKQERCKIRLRNEKQFNRKISINAELRRLTQELETLL